MKNKVDFYLSMTAAICVSLAALSIAVFLIAFFITLPIETWLVIVKKILAILIGSLLTLGAFELFIVLWNKFYNN